MRIRKPRGDFVWIQLHPNGYGAKINDIATALETRKGKRFLNRMRTARIATPDSIGDASAVSRTFGNVEDPRDCAGDVEEKEAGSVSGSLGRSSNSLAEADYSHIPGFKNFRNQKR